MVKQIQEYEDLEIDKEELDKIEAMNISKRDKDILRTQLYEKIKKQKQQQERRKKFESFKKQPIELKQQYVPIQFEIEPGQIPTLIDPYDKIFSNQDQKALQKQMKNIILRRSDLQNLIHKTKFQQIVTGLYVRIATSTQKVYMLAEIIGVIEGKKNYKLGKTKTNLCLRLKNGEQKLQRQMNVVSNTNQFGERQWTNWFEKNKLYGISDISQIKQKQLMLKKAFNQINDSQQINQMIQKRIQKVIKNHYYSIQDILPLLQFMQSKKYSLQYKIHQDDLLGIKSQQKIKQLKSVQINIKKLRQILENKQKSFKIQQKQKEKKINNKVKQINLQLPQPKKKTQTKFIHKNQLIRILSNYNSKNQYLQQLEKIHRQHINDFDI